LLFKTRGNGKADYYVVNPERYGRFYTEALISAYSEYAGNVKWAKMGTRRTDSLIIDFSNQYQAYRMFGNDAISSIINNKNLEAFKLSISHLEKSRQKKLKNKIEYIFDNDIHCHRVNENVCNIGMRLLEKFERHIKPKENIKNTVNDLLILATAIDKKKGLHTKDKVLANFAAEEYSGKTIEKDESIMVDFSVESFPQRKVNQESKGYINKGWAYSFGKGNL
jgi:predicted nucleic acid-binding protein